MQTESKVSTVRPAAIAAVIALEVAGGISTLVLGIIFLLFPTLAPTYLGVSFLVLGILAFVVVRGFQSGKGYAWPLALALSIVGVLLSIVFAPLAVMTAAMVGGLGLTGPISAMIISLVTIFYLTRPHVRTYRK